MTAARGTSLTLGEAACRLDVDVDALLEMVYSGQLPARLQDDTRRLLLTEQDVEQLQRRLGSEHAG